MASTTRKSSGSALFAALSGQRGPESPGLLTLLGAIPRMIGASLNGRYPALGKGRLLAMLLGVLYVISPVDLVPELVFSVFGLADDALVVTWLAAALVSESERFLHWERLAGGQQDPQDERVVPGEVI